MWLPTYFTEGKGVDFDNLWIASFPYVSGVLGIFLMALLGDLTQLRSLLAGCGYLLTVVFAYFAVKAGGITMTIVLFCVAVFFQMGYTSQEFAILQRILPKKSVGAGTGLYNGLAMFIGGGAGNFLVGYVVKTTGSFDNGIFTLLTAALLAGLGMIALSRFLKY